MAGQISGLIGEVKTCEAIISDIVNIGSETLDRLSSLKGGNKHE